MLIYKITDKINGKIYIGQTIASLKRRWSGHIHRSKKINTPLYNAIKKYGKDNFTIEEIDGANSQSELNYKEWLLIHKFNSLWPNGYNMMEGGGSVGKKSELSKQKMRIVQKMICQNRDYKNTKKVINVKTGEIYNSANEVAKKYNIKNIHCILNGKRVNDTDFRYLDKKDCTKNRTRKHSKRVMNIKTNQIYKSGKKCWDINKNILNIKYSSFRCKLNGHSINNTDFKYLKE